MCNSTFSLTQNNLVKKVLVEIAGNKLKLPRMQQVNEICLAWTRPCEGDHSTGKNLKVSTNPYLENIALTSYYQRQGINLPTTDQISTLLMRFVFPLENNHFYLEKFPRKFSEIIQVENL